MKIFYRISNNSYKKNRLEHATKEHCLENFLSVFGNHDINLIADNVTEPKLLEFIKSKQSDKFTIEYTSLNNAHAFRHSMRRACKELPDNELVYFVEDDYLHLPNGDVLLQEGLEISNYCTGYNHKDKYIHACDGGNPQIDGMGEITRVVLTCSSLWKLTNSTTCTWATHINILKEDMDIWEKATENSYPQDYWAFTELINRRDRSLLTALPGFSTHTEIPWLSPLISWDKI